jgi:hypothetical protein
MTALEIIGIVAAVAAALLAWYFTVRPRQKESADWWQEAGQLCHAGRVVVRDLEPGIATADWAASSRKVRAAWLRRAVGSANAVSAAASKLAAEAATVRARTAASDVSVSLARLAEAAADLAETMDDELRVMRLTREQAEAKEAMDELCRMVPPE